MSLREGDIEALKSRMKLEGKPIKTDVFRDKDGTQIFTRERGNGSTEITEKVK